MKLHRTQSTFPRAAAALWAFGLIFSAVLASASPFQEVHPSDTLYQRVKALEKYGLLDKQDQAVLDKGETVTRLQLAFYIEKAKSRLSGSVFPTPTPGGAAEPVIQAPVNVAAPDIVAPSKADELPGLVAPSKAEALPDLVAPQMAPAPALELPSNVSGEIDDLLKALQEEDKYLKARLKTLAQDTTDREAELAKLKKVQEEAEGIARKANKNSGDWSFNTNSKWCFEDITVTGQAPASLAEGTRVDAQRITKMTNEIYFGMWGALGKGSLSTGIGGMVSSSNDDSWPVSMYLGRPEFKLNLDGRLGTWGIFAMDEGFQSTTTMGDFTRGVTSERAKQYERPFNIKPFADDQKASKIWDDYIRSLGFVETQSLVGGVGQSTSDRVFDGVVADGSDLPYLGPTRIKLLAGRMLPLGKPWLEYGVKISRPWMKERFSTTVAGMWVDDPTNGLPTVPSMNMRNFTGEFSVSLKPLPIALSAEGAQSRFFTGIDTLVTDPEPLVDQAVQVQAACYPFNFYWQDIRPGYANFQSKVDLTGFNLSRYGYGTPDIDGNVDRYGEIGEANQLHSNRKGWRGNLGWNGRRDSWMQKALPTFFDYFVLNMDLANREERVAMQSANGFYLIEPWRFVEPSYADDEGLWGLDLNGGYGGYGSAKPTRLTQMGNIRDIRNRQLTDFWGAPPPASRWEIGPGLEEIRYRFCQTTERIPLLDPVTGDHLSHLKTYHYLAVTHKWQLNKIYKSSKPLYLGVYYANNRVSGKAVEDGQSDIDDLFTQKVVDFTLRIGRILPYADLLGHYATEEWNCAYTLPLVHNTTKNTGLGLDYDIPWGSAKLGLRWNHVVFESQYVPANNYKAEQAYGMGVFRF